MELVIGGRAQGKHEYVKNLYGSDVTVIDNMQDIINDIDYILNEYPDCIIICDEIGCGLVPIDKEERAYRDTVGRIYCELAKKAVKVHRVICGIGTVIKDA